MMRKLTIAMVGAALLLVALPSAASAAPPFTEASECSGDQRYFLMEYEDTGSVGVDSGCADQNDVTGADVPGLIANVIHTSCSDKIPDGNDPAKKSDFGVKADGSPRFVTAYTIIKLKDGRIDKQCGVGNPIPSGGIAGNALTLGFIVAAGMGVTLLARRRRTAAIGVGA